SSTSKAGVSSPAACTVICMRPPESAAIRSATRSADRPGPGRRFGQEVTMRQRLACARATEGAASVAAAAAMLSERRVSLVMGALLPPGVEMMHGALAVADAEFVGGSNRGGDIGFC